MRILWLKTRSLNWSIYPLFFLHRSLFAHSSPVQDVKPWWWAAEEDDDDAQTSFRRIT